MGYSLLHLFSIISPGGVSHYFWILCWKSLTSEHKIEFLRLTVEELQALQAKGLIFLIIFGFFVENH